MFEPAEGFGMDDPVAVVLKSGPDAALFLCPYSPATLGTELGIGRKKFLLSFFQHLTNQHDQFPSEPFSFSSSPTPDPCLIIPRNRPLSSSIDKNDPG
jgi:hypothetical protein